MGPIIPFLVGDMQPADAIYPMAVVGRFLDYRNFSTAQIQNWVDNYWIKNEEIKVENQGRFSFFIAPTFMTETIYSQGKCMLPRSHTCSKMLVPKRCMEKIQLHSLLIMSPSRRYPLNVK